MITICLTYFKSLTLANFVAALYSVRQQDFSNVKEVLIFDNDTSTRPADIFRVVDELDFYVPVKLYQFTHGDSMKTHSYSTNQAIKRVKTPWILFTRADYILEFDALEKMQALIPFEDWRGFVTARFRHLHVDISECNRSNWRAGGPNRFRSMPGNDEYYSKIDSGVWLTRKNVFDSVGGLDETLTAWGHAQTHFQYKLYKAGVEFREVPEVLFYHPAHGGERDIDIAHEQLRDLGVDIKEMWSRYEGPSPY